MKLRTLAVMLVYVVLTSLGYTQEDKSKPFYQADTVTVVASKNVVLPKVATIAMKMPIPMHSTPASVGIVNRSMIDRQDAIVLSDALKNISGVNVQSGFGVHEYFLIRGFDALSNGLVLTDGAPEPKVTFYNLYNVERVEVLKGPGAFLYGGSPLSGTVNLSRKQPSFRKFMNLSGSFGKFQTYRGSFDAGFMVPGSDVAVRINGMWRESDHYRDELGSQTFAINPAMTWRLGETGSLTANFEYVDSDSRPDSGLPLQFAFNGDGTATVKLPQVPRTISYQTPYDISDQDAVRARLDFEQRVNPAISIRNKFYITELNWQSTNTLLEGVSNQASRTVVNRTLQFLDDSQRFIGNQLEALFSYRTGSVKHRLLVGLEVARQRDDLRLLITSPGAIDLVDPVEENLLPKQLLLQIPITLAKARTLIYSSYFVSQMAFGENLQLFTGGRFDVLNYDDRRRDLIGFEGIIPLYQDGQLDRNHERLSPMLGLLVSPATGLSFYVNAGQAFSPASALTNGDPQPQQSTQVEIGTRTSWLQDRVNASLSVYLLEKDNISIPDDNGILRETGDQRSRGVELEISAQPVPGWLSHVSYAYTDAELVELRETLVTPFGFFFIDYSGNRPAFAPKHLLNLWTSKEFPCGLGVSAGLRYVSSQFIAESNRFELSDYLTVDLSLSYTFRNLRWSLNVKNVTNQKFETRGYGASSVIPANPMAAYSGLEISL